MKKLVFSVLREWKFLVVLCLAAYGIFTISRNLNNIYWALSSIERELGNIESELGRIEIDLNYRYR